MMTSVLLDKLHYGVNGVNISMKHMHYKFYIPDVSISRKRSNKNYNDHAKNEVSSQTT